MLAPKQRPCVKNYDFIVVGGGIAGAAAGFELAAHARVLLIERESQPGYHSTGRSAAIYMETRGAAVVGALTTGSKAFFLNPPDGFSEHPLLSPRGALVIGRADQTADLDRAAAEWARLVGGIRRLSANEARNIVPVLREGYVAGAILDPQAMDIDVHALHYGFLRGLRKRGGTVLINAELRSLEFSQGAWIAETAGGRFPASAIVNAAGAWCDRVALMAGARPVGLVPKRRTALTFDPPPGIDIDAWPFVVDIRETFYFKPDAGKLLASPADETPVEPCDAYPEDIDVAIAVDRIQAAVSFTVKRINRRWAGLRSFVADECPIVGYDPEVTGFFWLAGQGGYGIKTSPAMGRLSASLALGRGIPSDLVELGVTESALSPARFIKR
jgi:D-arginine dehydrogenase